MTGLPRQSPWIAAAAIALLAGLGLYEGLERSAAPPDDQAAPIVPAAVAAPAQGAKAATALAEPAAPTVAALSESQIRSLVRQEVQAALDRDAAGPSAPEPLALTPRQLTVPPALRPSDPRSDAELLSGAGGGAGQ